MDRALLERLERIGDAAWPAFEREWYDGWLLRFADGVTSRSNSASPLRSSTVSLADKIARVEEWYRTRGVAPRYRLTPLTEAGLAPFLEDRGYVELIGADVMIRSLERRAPPAHRAVAVSDRPDPAWLDALSRFGDDRGRPEVMRRMLEAIERPVRYAALSEGDGVVSIGMAVAVEDAVAIFNMSTDPSHRRRGLATAVLAWLLEWGRSLGAAEAMLQVRPDNAEALALYRNRGFATVYRYRYLTIPTA